jgi:hypothetical protein
MFEPYLGHVRVMFGPCLSYIWAMFDPCLEHVYTMCWPCLGHVWAIFGPCHFGTMCWAMFGQCFCHAWITFGPGGLTYIHWYIARNRNCWDTAVYIYIYTPSGDIYYIWVRLYPGTHLRKPRINRSHRLLDLTNLRTLSDLFVGSLRILPDLFAGDVAYFIRSICWLFCVVYQMYLHLFVYYRRLIYYANATHDTLMLLMIH